MSELSPDLQILSSVVGTLDMVVLTRPATKKNEEFRTIGNVPQWFDNTFGDLDSFIERSPFLTDFIEGEAHDCWQDPGRQVQSGLWEEHSARGDSKFLEATAMTKADRHVLVITLANERHAREQDYLQFAHDAALFQRKLSKERERKEVLLDCIVNDLGKSLSTILMNIQFVGNRTEQETLTQALERAEHQAKHQRELISSIADAFDADLSKFEPALLAGQKGVDVHALAKEAIATSRPLANKKKIQLILEPDPAENFHPKVLAEQVHLTRVMENLLNHLIDQSSKGDTISVQILLEEDSVKTIISTSAKNHSTSKQNEFHTEMTNHPGAGDLPQLGLYFCQMAVKHWGGKIEQHTTANGEFQISFELKKKIDEKTSFPAGSN